jgi:hypothetical protein
VSECLGLDGARPRARGGTGDRASMAHEFQRARPRVDLSYLIGGYEGGGGGNGSTVAVW